jgi:hypothetical protein
MNTDENFVPFCSILLIFKLTIIISFNVTARFKNVRNCLNTYLETLGCESFIEKGCDGN